MSEVGHARNAANLGQMIAFVTAYGTDYDPTNAAITVAALNAKKTAADGSIDDVTTTMGPYKMVVNDRQETFEGIRKLTTRVFNAFAASGASSKDVDDARTFKRKLDGARAKTLIYDPNTDEDESEGNSVSQQSYVQLVEHFDNFVQVLIDSGSYAPNETALQIATLQTYSGDLKAANSAVDNAIPPLSNARIARNQILYAETTGLVDVALTVKKYVKSLYGADSPQYKQISGLAFTRYKI